MKRVVVIGAGGVGNVVVHKCAQAPEVFSDILLASRTLKRCEAVQKTVRELRGREIQVAELDADDVEATARLLTDFKADLVINVALPYQDLSVMEACLRAGVHYIDTANYEPRDVAKFEYSWQWAYQERFAERGLTAVLGAGFDPGVTNVFCAHAARTLFDEVHSIDILDCNAGSHGHPFATNFNAEINLREITQRGKYWEAGAWIETEPLALSRVFDFPEVGPRKAYLLWHEELESLVRNIPGLQRIRFWMTFGDEYLTHLRVLQNVGMTGIEPIEYEGHPIVPMKFLQRLLPDPATLSGRYTGLTSIGCLVEGVKDGAPLRLFIYNVADHAKCHAEVRAQAISYTTGVPAMIAGLLVADGRWQRPGVWNVEQLDEAPMLELLPRYGLPWHVVAC